MNEGFLKFTVLQNYTDEEDFIHFALNAGSNKWSSYMEFYGNSTIFKEFAKKLKNFPKNKEVIFELGKRGNDPKFGNIKWAHYIYLRFYCYDAVGHVAIDVIMDNNGDNLPVKKMAQFSILSEVASVNELGEKLTNWKILETSDLAWETKTPTSYTA